MSGFSLEGFSYSGKLEDLQDSTYRRLEKRFVTVLPISSNRAAIDTMAMGLHLVGAQDRVVEIGSDSKQLVLTGHDMRVGDIVRVKTTANGILEVDVAVRAIIDANTVELAGVFSADLAAGDTFDILRSIPQRLDDSGASLASVTSPPLQFIQDAVAVTVTEDTVTPANNIPLPVKLTDITGDINITAGDLNVQLSHTGGTPDSTQIGDGTEILLISPSGQALTLPDGGVAHNAADSGNPIKVGAVYNAGAITLDDGDRSDLQVDVNGRLLVADVTLGAGSSSVHAQDAAFVGGDNGSLTLGRRQDTLAASTSTDGDYQEIKTNNLGELYIKDTDVLAQQVAMNAKMLAFDLDTSGGTEDNLGVNLRISGGAGSIEAKGQQTMASSIPVAFASDQSTLPISAATLPLPTGAATEATLALINAKDFATQTTLALVATEATLAAQSAKLPASLGAKTGAASLSVVLASDAVTPNTGGRSAVDTVRLDYSLTNVTTGAWVELKASVVGAWSEMEIFDSSGQTLELGFGAAASETRQILILPGGNGLIPLNGAAATRISLQAVSATADAGEIVINFYN